ncbi:MAG: hypothetical protein RLZZ88_1295 [Actinomycetota bacterium]
MASRAVGRNHRRNSHASSRGTRRAMQCAPAAPCSVHPPRRAVCTRRARRALGQSLGKHRHDEAGLRLLFADLLETESGVETK